MIDSKPNNSTPAAWSRAKLYRLGGLAAAQVVVLLGIAALAWATAGQGQVVRLRTRPLDPRDALYGDYVRLNYAISDLAPGLWQGPGARPDFNQTGRRVFVRLVPAGAAWAANGIYGSRPAANGTEAILPATVEGQWAGTVHLRYGLERMYLPEGTGPRLEAAARDTAGLLVRVAVAPWGSVRLLGVD
ncbi:MAG: GDYXXLXY domain-containing protein [Janthinobacterium lividum]